MMAPRYLIVTAGLIGLAAVAVGIQSHGGSLTVPATERAVLRGARAAVHGELERRESLMPAGRTRDDRLWRAYLGVVDKELAAGHVDVAVRVWHDAYGAALVSGSWESMIAVGDAFVAIGRAAGSVGGARMNAREAYLSALIRARRDRSVEGAIRTAEAFRELDERAVSEQCLHIAAQLAAGDEQALQRVHEARNRGATVTSIW
jgi:hypothetical protein